uniref:Odorant binging protein n=1 Tax=Agrilus zanthoxylumi TaxID=2696312 RepID=A0A8A6HV41_9COLE|nr:odorant binging protein [Agrilus zanthoxylumi]
MNATILFLVVLYLFSTNADPGKSNTIEVREWENNLIKDELSCINSTGVSLNVIERTKVTLELPEDDPKYKEYLKCFYTKRGYQNDSGEVLYDNIKIMIHQFTNATEATRIIDLCKETKGTTPEENAFVAQKCLLNLFHPKTEEEEKTQE